MSSNCWKKVNQIRYRFGCSNLKPPILKKGLSRNTFAVLMGVAGALALPPWHILPLLIPAFSGIYYLTKNAGSKKRSLIDGWCFGFGYFGCGLYWVGAAFFVEPELYGWIAPFAILAMVAGLAVFPAMCLWVLKSLFLRFNFYLFGGVTSFALVWAAFEWLRSWFLTGFPWNLIGTAWMPFEPALQIASVVGVLGLGAVTVFLASSPALLFYRERKLGAFFLVLAFTFGASLWGFGTWRLSVYKKEFVEGVVLRLVQPNVPQKLKWKEDLRLSHFQKLHNMSIASINNSSPTHIVWPETAVPFLLSNSPKLLKVIGAIAPPGGVVITGAPRAEEDLGRTWNSIHAINAKGEIIATYDKFHLVPFGEYVPLRDILPLTKLVEGRGDFSPGPGPSVLSLPKLPPVAPLICFEAIFFDIFRRESNQPDWILNLTNDAWFGDTAGPYQHLAAVRFRAIEYGVPLIRVANTGITAVVNPIGQIVASTPINKTQIIDTGLPKPLHSSPLFLRFKKFISIGFAGFFIVVGIILLVVRERKSGFNQS